MQFLGVFDGVGGYGPMCGPYARFIAAETLNSYEQNKTKKGLNPTSFLVDGELLLLERVARHKWPKLSRGQKVAKIFMGEQLQLL